MSIFNILLTALTLVPTNEGDTIQTERLDEVVVVSNSARQRVQSVQTGAAINDTNINGLVNNTANDPTFLTVKAGDDTYTYRKTNWGYTLIKK